MDNKHNEELLHYGVKGMRWGVRRATKKLYSSNSNDDARYKAVATLQKHRSKAIKQLGKLENQHGKLASNAEKHIMKTDGKAAKIKSKAAKAERKAYGRFTSYEKSEKLKYKAGKLNAKADRMIAESAKAKAKLAKNEKIQSMMRQGVNDIDKALIEKGKKYLNGPRTKARIGEELGAMEEKLINDVRKDKTKMKAVNDELKKGWDTETSFKQRDKSQDRVREDEIIFDRYVSKDTRYDELWREFNSARK